MSATPPVSSSSSGNRDTSCAEADDPAAQADIGREGAAFTGAAVGFVAGAMAGPPGAIAGTVLGAVIGANLRPSHDVDRAAEEAYWREHHHTQPFAKEGHDYHDYARAYETGYTGYRPERTFDEREAELRMDYEGDPQRTGRTTAESENLQWQDVSPATRAAYERIKSQQKPS